ncbi:LacI family DNA-binding transcriptional regulator [Bauldia litoralis]|uniref:LacI family DNA-binding transcriptional regulator n=1 Tax=Bauldia litoralis TaxID=665467 RepID=UPI003265383C
MATLKDVAALAGVSTATVSLALNGGPVNEKTRETVKKAARQLNYFPNKIGRMLNSGRSNTIELVILTSAEAPNIVRRTSLFYYLIEGILAVADQNNLSMRFAVKSYEEDDVSAYFSELVGGRTVGGVIILPQFARATGFTQVLERARFPFVMLRPAAFGTDVSFVDMGNYEGARMVAELLAKCGANRLGIINGPATHVDAIERERGFTDTLLEAGAALVAKVHGAYTIESGFEAMKQIAARKNLPEAVFCANDYMAAGAIKYLTGVGIRVPQDIAIVGYDNNDMATAIEPELTTIDNRFYDLGSALASNLLALIKEPGERVETVILPRMVLRRSHAPEKTRRPAKKK